MSSEPSKAELLRRAIENRLLDLHTSIPAVVEKYDPQTQTIDARVTLKRAIRQEDEPTRHEEFPILRNIRVKFPKGNIDGHTFFMTWPLSKGDPVDLVCDEQYAGQYRDTGVVPSEVTFVGRFNLSSCWAIPGGGADKDKLDPNDADLHALVLGIAGTDAQVKILVTGDPPAPRIFLGKFPTSRVALAQNVAQVLSDLIHTIRTATASGTETGLATIIAALNVSYGSVPEVTEDNLGADLVYGE